LNFGRLWRLKSERLCGVWLSGAAVVVVRMPGQAVDAQADTGRHGVLWVQRKLQGYIELSPFDQFLMIANQRNAAFFSRLGLPVNGQGIS
jgi:hypothetical protein